MEIFGRLLFTFLGFCIGAVLWHNHDSYTAIGLALVAFLLAVVVDEL